MTLAIDLFRREAVETFTQERDLQADIGEDITAEALDLLGMSRVAQRVFGKMDYKRARYIFEPDYALRQILLVDSKAEKTGGVARIQTSQTSMRIRQRRVGQAFDVAGTIPKVTRRGNSTGNFASWLSLARTDGILPSALASSDPPLLSKNDPGRL